MRGFDSLWIPTVGLFLLVCCHKNDNLSDTGDSISGDNHFTETKVVQGHTSSEDFFVKTSDVESYINYLNTTNRENKSEIIDFTAYRDNNGDTVFYAINFEHGWQLLSADKRGPLVLAESFNGNFAETVHSNNHITVWLESIAADIRNRRVLESRYGRNLTKASKEKEDACILFWERINPIPSEKLKPSKRYDPSLPMLPLGHWELVSSISEPEDYFFLDHLCQTRWYQRSPFNIFCPPRTDGEAGNMPAGCTAIAGGQMLNYLHGKIGVPTSLPTSLDANYYGTNYSSSSVLWTKLNSAFTINPDSSYTYTYSDTLKGLFIRDIGTRISTDYGNSGSGAFVSDLINNVFIPRGISAVYQSYDVPKLTHSLKNGYPVVISAYGDRIYYIFGIYQDTHGHAFLIDGYKERRNKITGTYRWIWEPHTVPVPDINDTIMITYSDPYLAFIKMNWGWHNYDDDIWFAPYGSWPIDIIRNTGDTLHLHYDYTREMICDFSVL